MAVILTEDVKKRLKNLMSQNRTKDGYNIQQICKVLDRHRSVIRRWIEDIENEPKLQFECPRLPSHIRSIDEIIRDKIAESNRNIEADDARDLISVKVNIEGPFGLLIVGDPHIDDPGCNFELLKKHIEIAQKHPYIVAAGIGDNQNLWIGRLARLYADQTITARESWLLCEWLIRSLRWLFMIQGNHDLWQGHGDPTEWFINQAGTLIEPHGVRLELCHPCGAKTRLHARHDFPGHSIYHALHGPKRESIMGFRDHIIVGGHKHVGGDEGTVTPDGLVAQIVRVSGYKQVDGYAKQLGLKSHPIHPSALVIVNPYEPETSRGRAWCAPDVENGVLFLDALRKSYLRSSPTENACKPTNKKRQTSGKGPSRSASRRRK